MSVRKQLSSAVGIAWLIAAPAFAGDPSVPPLPPYLRGSDDHAAPAPSYPAPRVDRRSLRDAPPVFPIIKTPPAPIPLAWSWTGFYVGAHVGGGAGTATFADPFGSSIYGDIVRTPAFLGGGQIGFNWQVPNSPWVLGAQADISGLASQGTNTCFAYSGSAINATCRVSPEAASTVTGRFGYAFGPDGRTLVYAKGGLAWDESHVDMALNNCFGGIACGPPFFGPAITSNGSNPSPLGWTAGAGAEYALTPAWSLFAEYGYLDFGSTSITNLGSTTVSRVGAIIGTTPPGSSGLAQNLQEFKLGLNYKLGANPLAPGLDGSPGDPFPIDRGYQWSPVPGWGLGWELETGFRYVYSWGLFHKDLGQPVSSGSPTISSISRLTYDDIQTNSGELFARLDTPWNFFVKGFVGGGWADSGHMNDEDFGIPLLGAYAPYSNTLSSNVTANTLYGVFDGGYDLLQGSTYKVGAFVGYFYFGETMSAFGCAPIANINCIPNVPASGSPIITETDHWDGLRLGTSAEMMLTPQIKLNGDVAYLPYATFSGVDNHFFGNVGLLGETFPATGRGQGVQLEGALSYYLTPMLSVGVGARYWGLWTTSATYDRTFDALGAFPSVTNFYRATTEQAGAFLQLSYKFGVPAWFVARPTQ